MGVRLHARVLVLSSAASVILGLRYTGAQDNASESFPDRRTEGWYDEAEDRADAAIALWRPEQASFVSFSSWTSLLQGPSLPEKVPRRLWHYWELGKDDSAMPPLNKYCLRQWERMNGNWQVTLLDENSMGEMFPELADMFRRIPKTVQARSDMLRIAVLAKYGGVWADASLLPLAPLDSFVQQAAGPVGFWAWAYQPYDYGRLASWFLAAEPNNALVVRWRDALLDRWEHKSFGWMYRELHRTLTSMVGTDKVVTDVWNRMPKVSQSWPHQCLEGCVDFWTATAASERPPMLKRPFQNARFHLKSSDGSIPEEWWAGYRAAVGA